ncbi:hypothetical protein DL546_000410 [Coniochaeta pulveracea]|uniref:Uncharacterized protein n=1 Tax=Coniochaeta pulveracea TaxID=177199 RepID=A0A420XWS0_9PEZI|nr:hypothetical protein DL546_000410 [Coniochaeta pulveracea]
MKGLFAVAVCMAFMAYSVLLVTMTSTYWKKERLHGANVIDTPLRKYIEYQPKIFNMTETSKCLPLTRRALDGRNRVSDLRTATT